MLENGMRLNRHARKHVCQQRMKRKATPLNYSSFNAYVEDEDKKEWMISPHTQRMISNGYKPYHHRWWKSRWGCLYKKLLKEEAHVKSRSYYRDQLAHYDVEEDSIQMKKKFGDPWNWN